MIHAQVVFIFLIASTKKPCYKIKTFYKIQMFKIKIGDVLKI